MNVGDVWRSVILSLSLICVRFGVRCIKSVYYVKIDRFIV